MSERITITLAEEAALELAGAARRLHLAQQAFEDFQTQHVRNEPKRAILAIELDEASRQYRKALEEYVVQAGGDAENVGRK